MAYSDVQRAMALELVRRADGQVSASVLDEIRAAIGEPGITAKTVRNWLRAEKSGDGNSPEKKEFPALRDAVAAKLDQKLENVANLYADHLADPKTVALSRAKDAATVLGITIDKMQLLRGLPTEIVQVLPAFVNALNNIGVNPADAMNAMIARAHQEKQRRDADGD